MRNVSSPLSPCSDGPGRRGDARDGDARHPAGNRRGRTLAGDGWYAAENSYLTAVDAYASLGVATSAPTATPFINTWWLDVETANSWRSDAALDVTTLQGAVDYLASRSVVFIGFYSTASQ